MMIRVEQEDLQKLRDNFENVDNVDIFYTTDFAKWILFINL